MKFTLSLISFDVLDAGSVFAVAVLLLVLCIFSFVCSPTAWIQEKTDTHSEFIDICIQTQLVICQIRADFFL